MLSDDRQFVKKLNEIIDRVNYNSKSLYALDRSFGQLMSIPLFRALFGRWAREWWRMREEYILDTEIVHFGEPEPVLIDREDFSPIIPDEEAEPAEGIRALPRRKRA